MEEHCWGDMLNEKSRSFLQRLRHISRHHITKSNAMFYTYRIFITTEGNIDVWVCLESIRILKLWVGKKWVHEFIIQILKSEAFCGYLSPLLLYLYVSKAGSIMVRGCFSLEETGKLVRVKGNVVRAMYRACLDLIKSNLHVWSYQSYTD